MRKKSCWKITPVDGYDIPALENWMEKLAAKGLTFSMTAGPVTIFDRADPVQVQIHLEPAREKTDQEDFKLTALYEAAGWRFLGIFRKNYFVFTTQDLHAQAHTDPKILGDVLRRFHRQKLLGGLGLLVWNLLLLSFYGSHIHVSPSYLKYFPVESLTRYPLVASLLVVAGLLLVDLSYFLGLWSLYRLRRRLSKGMLLSPAPGSRLGGGALFLGSLALLVVLATFCSDLWVYSQPNLPLEGSNFVTLQELEGKDFRLTGDSFFNMDSIAYTNVLLMPERWYFHQYGTFPHYGSSVSLNDIPHLELTVCRYPFPFLAEGMVTEWSYSKNWGDYVALPPSHGLDQVLAAGGEGGMYLILRRGTTVLRADYQGTQNLTDYLDRFAEMLKGL
ncbi:MAG: DUF2812 domain-containing protein [Lawsonibacter sp.]|nr:DUF2812 domain-containing protein [Lawsonibacter sp.]